MPQLDGLRAVAVGLVFLQHFTQIGLLKALEPGFLGVRLFFVMSGYLITRILLVQRDEIEVGSRSLRSSLWTFTARRALRIFPAFYAFLAFTLVVDLVPVRETWAWHVFYLSNVWYTVIAWETGLGWGTIGHLWSLAVEEQFYLVWPAAIFLTPRNYLPYVIGGTVLFAPLFRSGIVMAGGSTTSAVFLTPGCGDALGMGALLALYWGTGRQSLVERGSALAGIPLLLLGYMTSGVYHAALFGLGTALAGTALVGACARGMTALPGRFLSWQPVVWIGSISYGLYLWHSPTIDFVRWISATVGVAEPTGLPGFLAKVALSFALALGSWYLVEKPFLRLKRRVPSPAKKTESRRSP